MRSVFVVLLAAGCLTGCSRSGSPDQWQTLFDGRDLAAFNTVGDANWTIGEDAVRADAGNGFLVTKESFDDFELEAEFWADEPANSGIFVRCPDAGNVTDQTCYEVNIYDTRPDQTYRTGSIVHVASPRAFINAADRWNTVKVVADGPRLTVELNGFALAEAEDDRFARGHIGLQRAAGTIMFRNVRVRQR